MNIKSIFSAFLLIALLPGCSSTPSKPDYSIKSGSKYFVRDVDVNLSQKRDVEGYPSGADLAEIFSGKVVNFLEQEGVLGRRQEAGNIGLSIVVDYRRRFAGEDTPFPSKSVVRPLVSYVITAYEDDMAIDVIKRTDLTTSHGFFGNLKTVATGGMGNDAQAEEEDIGIIASGVAELLAEISR